MLRITLFSLSVLAANAYVWPSPKLDALESLRFNQDGHNSGAITVFIEPCGRYLFDGPNVLTSKTGRSDVADWVRTAYHDMATHNVTDGTGGLDASIRFAEESLRAENIGDGFNNTFQALRTIGNRYVSLADSLALGTIVAIENCGGPEIAFRGGRVDATEPNAPGVPEPQQDLDSHIAAFARQGFTQTEMISLVACGHTFGGVQHAAFPDTVPEINDPNNTQSVAHFDSTFTHFDNNVAIEYMSDTTQNPLVVGLNDTTNSDKRIFGSDGNVTMKSFADSPELFASTCADLIARMLDTVPREVELTEIITPLRVKPQSIVLSLAGDTLKLSGEVRLWNTTADPQRTVHLLWDDHLGGTGNATLTASGVSSAAAGRYNASWYTFSPDPTNPPDGLVLLLSASAGITSMRFVVDGALEDQGGVGFAVQDGVVYSETSCSISQASPSPWRMDVAVRDGFNPTRVFLERMNTDSTGRITILETDIARPAQPVAANADYSIWSINVNGTDAAGTVFYSIGYEVDGVKFAGSNTHFSGGLASCAV